jgi:hypothetical protein
VTIFAQLRSFELIFKPARSAASLLISKRTLPPSTLIIAETANAFSSSSVWYCKKSVVEDQNLLHGAAGMRRLRPYQDGIAGRTTKAHFSSSFLESRWIGIDKRASVNGALRESGIPLQLRVVPRIAVTACLVSQSGCRRI